MYSRKRYYKRRSYARRRSTLSTRNIYARRSSLAQAGQIAALKRKVNKVYNSCKPEIKRKYRVDGQYNFNNTIAGDVSKSFGDSPISEGSADDERIGDKIYCKTKYLISAEYYNNSNTGYHNSESAGCQLRVIVGRYKDPQGSSDGPDASDLIEGYQSSGANYTISAIAPLKSGLTQHYYIDSDKVYYLTTTKNQKVIKVSTPYYVRRFGDNKSNHSFCVLVCAGLHADANFTEEVNYCLSYKTTFTDA